MTLWCPSCAAYYEGIDTSVKCPKWGQHALPAEWCWEKEEGEEAPPPRPERVVYNEALFEAIDRIIAEHERERWEAEQDGWREAQQQLYSLGALNIPWPD